MSDPAPRTGRQIRQDFLGFFEAKQHTLVPSASLMPDAPNLLFTNAGMNQFVPIFLGEQKYLFAKKILAFRYASLLCIKPYPRVIGAKS